MNTCSHCKATYSPCSTQCPVCGTPVGPAKTSLKMLALIAVVFLIGVVLLAKESTTTLGITTVVIGLILLVVASIKV